MLSVCVKCSTLPMFRLVGIQWLITLWSQRKGKGYSASFYAYYAMASGDWPKLSANENGGHRSKGREVQWRWGAHHRHKAFLGMFRSSPLEVATNEEVNWICWAILTAWRTPSGVCGCVWMESVCMCVWCDVCGVICVCKTKRKKRWEECERKIKEKCGWRETVENFQREEIKMALRKRFILYTASILQTHTCTYTQRWGGRVKL